MDAELVRQLLLQRKIATMPELKAVLGTEVDLTVFRTLRALAYHSSYSHRGKYYTLHEIARFDELGLWSFRSVFFSQCGTLRRTCETLVGKADAGYATDELEHVLHVGVKDPLRELARQGRIGRDKVAGRFVYFSIVLFFSLLDERQRRLYAGLESMKLGHGGDRQIAELLGLDPDTVARGRKQLRDQDVERERVRTKGAGRKPAEKKRRR
jgi:hypothetical protein